MGTPVADSEVLYTSVPKGQDLHQWEWDLVHDEERQEHRRRVARRGQAPIAPMAPQEVMAEGPMGPGGEQEHPPGMEYNWEAEGPGEAEGAAHGEEEGAAPGEEEGAAPGEEEGAAPGEEEGAASGEEEGAASGEEEGAASGEEEGAAPGEEQE